MRRPGIEPGRRYNVRKERNKLNNCVTYSRQRLKAVAFAEEKQNNVNKMCRRLDITRIYIQDTFCIC